MGPMLALHVSGLAIRTRVTTVVVFATVVGGASVHSSETEVPPFAIAAISCLAVLAVILLHDAIRAVAYRRLGVCVRGMDLTLVGGSPRVVDSTNSPRRESIAGLAGLVLLAPVAIVALLAERSVRTNDGARDFLNPVSFAVVALAVTQAMPALPLDGGRILRGLVWHLTGDPVKGSRGAAIYGHFISAGLIAVGLLFVTEPGANAFWGFGALLAGLQIVMTSAASVRDAICQQAGSALTLDAVTLPWPRRLDANASVADAVDALIAEGGSMPLLLTDGQTVLGTLRMTDLRKVKRALWEQHRVAEIATPISATPHFAMSDTAWSALSTLEESGSDFGGALDDRGGFRLVNRDVLIAHLFGRVVDRDRSIAS